MTSNAIDVTSAIAVDWKVHLLPCLETITREINCYLGTIGFNKNSRIVQILFKDRDI